jgi:hypothetical protein
MKIEPTGIVMIGECELQLAHCTARTPAPITAVWTGPSRRQVDVCRRCLEDMVRSGDWEIPGAKINTRVDLAVYDKVGSLQLVVDVKLQPAVKPLDVSAWAIRVRRNLLAHAGVPASPFFLFAAYPTSFFLWTPALASLLDAAPEFSFDIQEELSPFLESSSDGDVQEADVRDAIATWLRGIINRDGASEDYPKHDWRLNSGLMQAIRGGHLVTASQADVPVALVA